MCLDKAICAWSCMAEQFVGSARVSEEAPGEKQSQPDF